MDWGFEMDLSRDRKLRFLIAKRDLILRKIKHKIKLKKHEANFIGVNKNEHDM